MSKKGTWPQALLTFILPILIVMGLRWIVIEPFVIPSGSMIPNLLVHDHIIVKKYSLGIRVPFTEKWLMTWRPPRRGEITVFHYPTNPDVYYVKRLIGLPGDSVRVDAGKISVNGQEWTLQPEDYPGSEYGYDYYRETVVGGGSHMVRFLTDGRESDVKIFVVPEGEYFFMGDNRDQSSDSRAWGFVKKDLLVGPATMIWLSCENTLASLSYICDPAQIRWSRIGRFL
jgi:signal peptidase I